MKKNKRLILNDLSLLLRTRYSGSINDIILFGSQVFGVPNKDSDYDVLIILNTKTDWKTEREISDLCYEIDLKYNIITDTHVLDIYELASLRGKQPIYAQAIEKGMHA